MIIPESPKDGDFASYLEARQKTPAANAPGSSADVMSDASASVEPPRQTIEQVLIEGQEPTEEFLKDWNALANAPELSDEEFAQQALNAPGDDGDTRTPE